MTTDVPQQELLDAPSLKLYKVRNKRKTIKLKDNIYLTELNLDEKDFIIHHKTSKTLDIASAVLGINCSGITLIGSTSRMNVNNVSKYIGYFLGADQGKVFNSNNPFSNRQIHYRDYAFSEERQLKNMWLLNLCPDIRMSINSLKRAITSEYCCIWKKEI